MVIVPTVVKKSPVAGKGLFAAKKIKKGQAITKTGIKERHYTVSQYEKFSRQYKKLLENFSYWDYDPKNGRRIIVYPFDNIKYLNHSCEPNVINNGDVDLAAKDIKPGEELTYNYAPLLIRGEAFKCACGSANCKKVIQPA